jgi:hypothetical protein
MRGLVLFLVIAVVLVSGVSAQTAEQMDDVLNTPQITHAQAVSFIRGAAEGAPGIDYSAAQADKPLKLGDLSLLIMKSFDIKGGLWYSLLPSRRYANRFLVHKKVIQGASDPWLTVSGEKFLTILGRAAEYTGADK